jgi:glucose/arabinose dehydrogenase
MTRLDKNSHGLRPLSRRASLLSLFIIFGAELGRAAPQEETAERARGRDVLGDVLKDVEPPDASATRARKRDVLGDDLSDAGSPGGPATPMRGLDPSGVELAQSGPAMRMPGLGVRTLVDGLVTPIGLAFVSDTKWLVIEKMSGAVKVVENGVVVGTALDLAVNNASERGLLGIALHPNFTSNRYVYLFWSCIAAPPPANAPLFPTARRCEGVPQLGADSEDVLATPLLGNRIDRFVWNDASGTLAFDRNLISLRSFQNDSATSPQGPNGEVQPPLGNHNGGVLRFGPDSKLYVQFGDVGRRGQLQNLPSGPTPLGLAVEVPDDQFGGPQPDDAHFTGVILRLNDDGSTPFDNPFFDVGAQMGGQVGENVQKIFSYGIRNGFGMAFDPLSGQLWDQENGEDAFDELNLVERGSNSGWIQIQGPLSRLWQYKRIEMTSLKNESFPNLQQFRWGPENIAATPQEALARLFVLPESRYSEPEYSWVHVVAPAGIGFLNSQALGSAWAYDLFVGFSSGNDALGGGLMAFQLSPDRMGIEGDIIADNVTFNDPSADIEHIVGTGFGVVTDIATAPNGNLVVVSLDRGAIFEVFAQQ